MPGCIWTLFHPGSRGGWMRCFGPPPSPGQRLRQAGLPTRPTGQLGRGGILVFDDAPALLQPPGAWAELTVKMSGMPRALCS